MNSAHGLFFQATSLIREVHPPTLEAPPTPLCAVCGRPFEETETPGSAYPYRYGGGMATEYLCLACATPRIAAPRVLGVERLAGGNPEAPVGAKLGMLPGSGGLITPAGELHLALPAGFVRKFADGLLAARGQVHQCSSLALLLHFHRDGRLGPLAEGFVFIEQFGRKADRLMAGLRLSRGLEEVWFNSDEGARPVDVAALIASAHWLIEHDLAGRAQKPAFWRALTLASKGARSERALATFAEALGGVEAAQALIDRLPVDPHDRVDIVRYMRAIIPILEAEVGA